MAGSTRQEAAASSSDGQPLEQIDEGKKPWAEAVEPGPTSPAPMPAESEQAPSSGSAFGAEPLASETERQRSLTPPWFGGLTLVVLGALPVFLLMASDRHWSISVPVGFAGTTLAILGILEWLGSFRDDETQSVHSLSLRKLRPHLLETLGSGTALLLSLRFAVSGSLPLPRLSAAILITASFLWLISASFRCLQKLGVFDARGLRQRHGFWLLLITSLLYLPMLGNFSLSDPWETHYGEVAREMLARDDWISLWWAQDGWFWSKPIFNFWLQGLGFSLTGTPFAPDAMLGGLAQGRLPQPEWAARMPVFLLTLGSVYVLYKGVAKVFGGLAGLLGGLLLVTTPYFYFIGHQTMADMPYVAPLCAAIGFLLIGFFAKEDELVRSVKLQVGQKTLCISAFHALVFAILLCVIPQILYLLSRNLTLHLTGPDLGFRFHLDEFFSGSGGGNCGLPGNSECRDVKPVNRWFQPALAAGLWSVLTAILLRGIRNERRVQRLAFIAAWLFTALSAMAKGAPGLVLPVFVAVVFVIATKRYRDLQRLEPAALLLLVVCIVLPWYVQMTMRHGHPFLERLLMHDMYKRAFVHVHDTNAGDDVSFRYYVWQLGYGLFPWTGVSAAGLLWWFTRDDEARTPKADASTLLGLWFVGAFAMFTITLTKFHHYILPAVPPIAMLGGVFMHRLLQGPSGIDREKAPTENAPAENAPAENALAENAPTENTPAENAPEVTSSALESTEFVLPWKWITSAAVGALFLLYGCIRLFPGSLFGAVTEAGAPPAAKPWLGGLSILLGLGLGAWAVRLSAHGGRSVARDAKDRHFENWVVGALSLGAAIAVALAGRDLFTNVPGDPKGQVRLMQLFTYQYRRPWPESLDFDGVLMGFTLCSAALCALVAIKPLRRTAALMLAAVGCLWAAWGLDVYFVKAAPHWGQRETVMAYYQDRESPDQLLVAYQMNWKGENFYTGNRMPAFVRTGKEFKDWLLEQKKKGVRVMYFTTEHSRQNSLKNELGEYSKFELITDKTLNNKFFVARVEF